MSHISPTAARAWNPALAACLLLPLAAAGQAPQGWQACAAEADAAARLACFDRWAHSQGAAAAGPVASRVAPVAMPVALPPREQRLTPLEGCHDPAFSAISRFWELEPGADCGSFGIRGYRPITLAATTANTVNRQPSSGNPANTADTAIGYRTEELRLQLSLRTKVASGLLKRSPEGGNDALWLGYTQQSYWQLFSPSLSRPFRSTDHEPELIYILPLQSPSAGLWRVRYAGLGIVHQSNGQSLPYSRSWNRAYIMAGAEHGPFQLHGRLWRRTGEGGDDDNPGISSTVGRAELRGQWQLNRRHLLAATVRHSLGSAARGSLRLEWFRALGASDNAPADGLQLHTQLFTGWGDSMVDFNLRRTVFSVGLSLVEW